MPRYFLKRGIRHRKRKTLFQTRGHFEKTTVTTSTTNKDFARHSRHIPLTYHLTSTYHTVTCILRPPRIRNRMVLPTPGFLYLPRSKSLPLAYSIILALTFESKNMS